MIGVLYCTPFCVLSQNNLILNPSGEDYSEIPNNLAGYPYCNFWWDPYVYTTDYFTSETLSSNNNYIPQNSFGTQENFDGNFYLGIILLDWIYSLNDYFHFRTDYVGGQFSEPLTKDVIYSFEFYMSKAEKGLVKSNAIDVIITNDTIIDVNNYLAYGYRIWSEELPMNDTLSWVKIISCFKAKGGEKGFAVGNFHDLEDVISVLPNNPGPTGDLDYRYLDNFSLIECPSCCPDQFPDEEQVFVYSNPSTENSPANIQIWLHPNTSAELEIFDYAGRLIDRRTYSSLLNNFIFDQYASGMYYFVVTSSDGLQENGKVLVSGF